MKLLKTVLILASLGLPLFLHAQVDSLSPLRKPPTQSYSSISLTGGFNRAGIDTSYYSGVTGMIGISHFWTNQNAAFGFETGISRVRKGVDDSTYRCLMLPIILVSKINLSRSVFLGFDAGIQLPLKWEIMTTKNASYSRIDPVNTIVTPMLRVGLGFYFYEGGKNAPLGEFVAGYQHLGLNLPHASDVKERNGFAFFKLGIFLL